MEGKVTQAQHAYQRITYVKPVPHYYGQDGDKPYIKFTCPVCDTLGNFHQVTEGDKNCPQCSVNLTWEGRK